MMWKRFSSKKHEAIDDLTPQMPQRQDEDGSIQYTSGSVKSSDSKRKVSSNIDDRDRGFNPTSTSYSSTSRIAYPNTAGASVASSHATASANSNDESYTTPVLNRNQSLADKMPKSSTSMRSGRDRDEDEDGKSKSSVTPIGDDGNGNRETKSKRDRAERKSASKNGGTSRSANGSVEGTSRGPADFSSQVGGEDFQQFPGQYDGGVFGGPGGDQNGTSRSEEHGAMSSHVQNQFPGQFPSESAEPYRPPLAASEGGPGLAADYYGDVGQSVTEQPGYRKHSPSLIIGQEPHLLPASSVVAPPPEPSTSGGIGAAASFFSGDFEANDAASNYAQQTTSTHTSAPSRPNIPATSSSLPSLGGGTMSATAAMGAAAGHAMSGHPAPSQQYGSISPTGTASHYMTISSQRPPSQSQDSYYSPNSRPPESTIFQPPTSGSKPTNAGNIPVYAAAAAGVAGLAGSTMHGTHASSTGLGSSTQQYATPITPRHRHRGPLGALVNFVKDPEGVAQFEEYSEYVGICRSCFEPGSSPRDAPRRHRNINRKRSDERIGRLSRIEKTRRDGSDDEKHGRKSLSWLAGGFAGYGLGKTGEGLFKQRKDFDDTYSVKSGRYSPDGSRKHRERRELNARNRQRRRAQDEVQSGVVDDEKLYKTVNGSGASTTTIHTSRRRSRSRSRDRRTSLAGASLGAAAGNSISGSSPRRRSRSGDRVTVKSKTKARNGSPSEGKHRSHKKKKEKKGFFSFGLNSSSSSLDMAHSRSSKKYRGKSGNKKAEAALLGLGAAAAALAATEGRSGQRKNGVKELVGRKETRDDRHQRPSPEDPGWEDEENYVSEPGSIDSALAFGCDSDESEGPKYDRRRRSEMSGKGSLPRRRSSWDNSSSAMTGAVGPAIVASEVLSPAHYEQSSRHDEPSPLLQHVDPIPVSDFAHLDERMKASEPFPSRPPLVSCPSEDTAFHQPQPRVPVSPSVYTTQAPSQTNPVTVGPTTYQVPSYRPDDSYNTRVAPDLARDFKLSRREASPARFGPDDASNELTYSRKPSAKDDSSTVSGVRFALSEKGEEDRRERRRRKKDSEKFESMVKERRSRDDEVERDNERSSRRGSGKQSEQSDKLVDSSSKSWAVPATAALAGVAVGAAAIAESRTDAKDEETREERRERRRREKRRDEEEGEARRERRRREKEVDLKGTSSKGERRRDDNHEETREERKARRRREREEREREEAASQDSPHVSFGDLPMRADQGSQERSQPNTQESPSKREVYKHEDYSSFFTPAISGDDDQQVKISGANADADISFDQSPNFVIAEPRELRDLSGTPDFSPADTLDKVDTSKLKLPWQVPRLRLLYPTPPSSGGSTPIIEPRDAQEKGIEEPSEITSVEAPSSELVRGRDTIKDHDVSPTDPPQVADRFRDPLSDDDLERLKKRKPKKIPLSIDQQDSPKGSVPYGDDNNFAAVLAASAEDAGFDPSIIIENPVYRRRDSPPGSNERHMPGGFDDEDDEPRPKKGKKKERSSRRQSPPEQRNDDVVVQNIIGQVEGTGSGKAREEPGSEDDDLELAKSRKVRKLKRGSMRSSTNGEAPEEQEPPSLDDGPGGHPSREDQTESSQSLTASTAPSKVSEAREVSQNSNHIDQAHDEKASAAAVASAVEAGKESKSNGKNKGSIWNRVLGKSTPSLPETSEDRDVKEEEPAEFSRKDSKKGKKSRRKSLQRAPDAGGERSDDDTRDTRRQDPEATPDIIPPVESIVQRLAENNDAEQSQENVSESFLGERPDPPPPPDINDRPEEPARIYSVVTTNPFTPQEIRRRRPSEIRISDSPQSPKAVTSPTAVPIHFRRPAPSRARSCSQSPLSSTQNVDDVSQPTRPRPRSTQFENSREYRPLWLVERNQPRQEVQHDEKYPPLPSSHSTSRNSSLHSLDRQHNHEMAETSTFQPIEGDHGLLIDTGSRTMQSEVLDSQQATPTASSFQRNSITRGEPSPPESASASPTHAADAHKEDMSSNLKHATLAAVVGSVASYGLHKLGKSHESIDQELPQEEFSDLHKSLRDLAPDAQKLEPMILDEGDDIAPQKKEDKKDKNSERRADQVLKDVIARPAGTSQHMGDPTESALPTQEKEGQGLTKDIPIGEVVNIRASTAHNIESVAYGASKSVTIHGDDTIGAPLDRLKEEANEAKKASQVPVDTGQSLEDQSTHQEPRDSKSDPSYSNIDFVDPFRESPHKRGQDVELSPMATPLPEGDDFDLLDGPPRPGTDDSIKRSVADETISKGETTGLQGQNEQGATDRNFAPSTTTKKGKKGKKSMQGDLEGDSLTCFESIRKPTIATFESVKSEDPQQVDAIEPLAVGSEGIQGAEGDFTDFKTKKGKKGKKAKQTMQDESLFENLIHKTAERSTAPGESATAELGKLEQDNAPNPEPGCRLETTKNIETVNVTTLSQDDQPAGDNLDSVSSKKNSKKGKKKKAKIIFEEPEQSGAGQPQPQSLEDEAVRTSHSLESDQHEDQLVQADRQIQSTRVPSRDTSVKLTQKAQEPQESLREREQVERAEEQGHINEDREDDPARATTSTSQEVQDILNESHSGVVHDLVIKEPQTIDQGLYKDQPAVGDGKTKGFRNDKVSTSFAENEHSLQLVEALAAATGTAAAVHNILHENSSSPAPADDQHVEARQEISNQSSEKLAQEDDIDLASPMKSKDNMPSRAERSSFDAPGGPECIEKPELGDLEPSASRQSDEMFAALSVKKTKKDKKDRKLKKGQSSTYDGSGIMEPAENDAPISTPAEEAPTGVRDETYASFVTKKSKKDKKDKKNKKNMSTSVDDQVLYDAGSGENEPAVETVSTHSKPDAPGASQISSSLPQDAAPILKEAEDGVLGSMSMRKSKKDKKSKKKGICRTTSGVQTPGLLDEPTPDQVQALLQDDGLADSQKLHSEALAKLPEISRPTTIVKSDNQKDQNQESQHQEPQGHFSGALKSEMDDGKSERSETVAWDDKNAQERNSEDVVETTEATDRDLVGATDTKQTGLADASEQVSDAEDSRSPASAKSKKAKKKAAKSKDFSWGAFESKESERDPFEPSRTLDEEGLTQQPSHDNTLAVEPLQNDESQDMNGNAIGRREAEQATLQREDSNAGREILNDVEGEPALKPKKSKGKKKSKRAQTFSWDENEPVEEKTSDVIEKPVIERTNSSFHVKADAIETPGLERNQPSYGGAAQATEPVVLPLQDPDDVPKQLTFNDIIEPSAIEQPHELPEQVDQPQMMKKGTATPDAVGADPDEEFPVIKKSKKGRKYKKKDLDLEPMDQVAISRKQEEPNVKEAEREEDDILVVEGHSAHKPADSERKHVEETPTRDRKKSHESVQFNADEPEIIERKRLESRSREQPSQPDTPLSAGSIEMLDPEEQREYNEEYRKQLEKELSPLREDDGLLDVKEQRNYNEEYRKELERQLSPSGRAEEVVPPAHLASEREMRREMDEVVEPIPLPKEATSHHTVLTDILEEKEPRSRSDSLKEPSAEADEGLERRSKKGKKSKQSKQSRQPVIWEDNTATQGLASNVESPINDLDEPFNEGRTAYKDLPSPTRGSPSATRSPKFDGDAEDYFAMKPRAQAEKEIGGDSAVHKVRSISPVETQDLPDWSSQPEILPFAYGGGPPTTGQKRNPRERSPSRERRSRDKSLTEARAPRESSLAQDEALTTHDRFGSVGEIAVATAAGAGIARVAELSKKESKEEKRDVNDRKNKRSSSGEDKEKREQDEASKGIPKQHEPAEKIDRMPGEFNDTPPRSPVRLAGLHGSHKVSQQEDHPNHRDSAIQITDSPLVPVSEPIHRPLHDSGYPATEASPVINDHDKDGQEEDDVIDPYTDPRIRGARFYRGHDERPNSIASDPRQSIAESDDQDRSGDQRGSRRRHKRRESSATYNSDDSNDSGYDKQRRRRQARQAEELREPSPFTSTTKNRSSVLFDSSPSERQILEEGKTGRRNLPENDQVHDGQHPLDHPNIQIENTPQAELHDPESYVGVQGSHKPRQSIFGSLVIEEEGLSRSRSPASNEARSRRQLKKISENSLENSPLARKGKREVSDVGSPDSGVKPRGTSHELSPLVTGAAAGAAVISTDVFSSHLTEPSKGEHDRSKDMDRSASRDQDRLRRLSNQSNTSAPTLDSEWHRQNLGSPDSIHAIIRTPDQVHSSSGQSIRSTGTPPLRRVDRSVSGDLRGASMKIDAKRRAKIAEAEPAPAILGVTEGTFPSSSTYDPLTDKGKSRGDMADVYEGDGWRGQSPMSPTRPPSMRKRQSMQFADLEQRFEQLAADHRSLQSAKSVAERRLEEQARDHSQQRQSYEGSLQEHKLYLAEKDSELSRLHEILDGFKRQVLELTAVNEELQTSRDLDPDRVGDQSFQILAGQHETTKRELEGLREQHAKLANDHEDILEREIEAVRQEKDYELQQLQEELERAKEEVRALQQQILASRSSDDYIEHDEDYFESKCTALCQHVQQWVLRFSKFSDTHACRLVGELADDTLADLFDDAILDGTEADDYLQDRVKRRDVFMSVVMSRIFDFIFRRYLFGLDREQRKKLKDLDATLTEVGPQSAVHKWRSTTLTLLSSRPEFAEQREADTEGVVDSIFQTLAAILPPKKDLIPQITDSLRRVITMAVDLHIEMRLQRAEFQMLPPLKPQFDPITGDLARKVPFNATMMNERSGDTESNEQLQEEGAVVRMVLFPLVMKNTDEEEQILVCPAQVLVAKEETKKKGNGKQVRVMSAQGARSEASFAGTEDTRMTGEGSMF